MIYSNKQLWTLNVLCALPWLAATKKPYTFASFLALLILLWTTRKIVFRLMDVQNGRPTWFELFIQRNRPPVISRIE